MCGGEEDVGSTQRLCVFSTLFDLSTSIILGPIGNRDQIQITASHNHTVKVRMGEKEKVGE